MKTQLLAIAGVSGSGKTCLARYLAEHSSALSQGSVCVIAQDNYYHDYSARSDADRARINFDHPHSFDVHELLSDLTALKSNRTVAIPQYDYVNHKRKSERSQQKPVDLIILEGILALHWSQLRALTDCSVYLNTPLSICLERRLLRDTSERGRTRDSVMTQYRQHVLPMYEAYISEQAQWADILVADGGANPVVLKQIRERL
ncbi:uridine kinase [Gilvimarinus sp. SDUM040013]|uniref:uridine/cytidine kinase n=1 Tax=Gilvimarinus gilvus TaxID=3058038 RepID=A0ABU4S251_9GAMM|nr:uridine kinase [Gilvimarinus sp. SDUM040013]MDO3388794.1 uridine kinase [Gilvimarinus sp. SDUM040013]MDX6850547.1 uridine kinase [Gilvimarinus sp. SDUM040013]